MLSTRTRKNKHDKQWLCRHCNQYFWAVRPPGRPQKYPRYTCTHCGATTGPPLPLSELHKIRWRIVSELVRRTHADEAGMCRCFTRKAKECPDQYLLWQEMHAGHYLPGRRQSAAGILYDRRGIFPQCYKCNVIFGGQPIEFQRAMLTYYGTEEGMAVCADLEYKKRQPHRWVRSDMEDRICLEAEELNELRRAMGDDEWFEVML